MCEASLFFFVSLLFVIFCLLEILNCKRRNNTLETPIPHPIKYVRQEYIEIMTEEEQEEVRGAMGLQLSPERR